MERDAIVEVKHHDRYYSNLATVSSLLGGFALSYVERSRGLGIVSFFAVLFLLFVVFCSMAYRSMLIRGKTNNPEVFVGNDYFALFIDLSFLCGILCYFGMMILLCIPYVSSVTPRPYNRTNPYESVNSVGDAFSDSDRIPMIIAIVAAVFIFIFFVVVIAFLYVSNKIIKNETKNGNTMDSLSVSL